jgi:hypothetical protein
VHADDFDETEFFRALAQSGARVLTKRWAMRDKDVADIRMLEELKRSRGG